MITGEVRGLQAFLTLLLIRDNQPNLSIEFVVDTGFADFLTLPTAAVDALNLPYLFTSGANLADDSNVLTAVHEATVLWDGQKRLVRVLATGKRPLLGMSLLSGSEMVAQFANGGLLTREAI